MPERIRVVEIINGFGIEGIGGGAERFAIALSQNLDPRRFEVIICGLWNRGTIFEQERLQQLNASGIEAFAAADWDENKPFRSFWRAFKGMQAILSHKPVQILHSHSQFGDVVALLFKLSKSPVILRTVHHGYHLEWSKRPLRRLLFTNLLFPLFFTIEIGVSRSIVENLNRRWLARLLGRQAIWVRNAIDLNRFTNVKVDPIEKRISLGLPPDALVVGSVGRLVEGKGYDVLIEGAALVLNKLPQAYFLLIGDGELANSLKELAQHLKIAGHVVFTGPRSDIEELLGCMDLFVLASLWEGLPTVILESMASGVPVVATDIPGNREIIQDQVNGWLVPPNNPEALADTIINALQEPSVRRKCAYHALGTVKAFSINAVASEHEALYLAALEQSI